MGWVTRAAGTGALVAVVCAVPATVAGLARTAGPAGAAASESGDDRAPQSAAEAEANRRAELRLHLTAVEDLLWRELPNSFAGTSIDDASGAAVIAATAAVPVRLRRAVSVLLPPGARIAYSIEASRSSDGAS